MTRFLLTFMAALLTCSAVHAQTWALATSTNHSNGRVIIFRFVQEFAPGFSRASQPDRVILAWKYQSEKGMPDVAERERMDAMEDALQPVVEKDNFATLALVSTGENLREWTYYVKSEAEFMLRLNEALSGQPEFPIDIHVAPDPEWTMYETFRSGVRLSQPAAQTQR